MSRAIQWGVSILACPGQEKIMMLSFASNGYQLFQKWITTRFEERGPPLEFRRQADRLFRNNGSAVKSRVSCRPRGRPNGCTPPKRAGYSNATSRARATHSAGATAKNVVDINSKMYAPPIDRPRFLPLVKRFAPRFVNTPPRYKTTLLLLVGVTQDITPGG